MITFFAVLMPGSDYKQKLALSKNFVSKFGSKLPETVVLKVPTGKATSVGITRTEDDIYFERGWAQFVVEHFLEENDFLVFTFNESNSVFDVSLFDKTACGKKVVVSTEDRVDSRSIHSSTEDRVDSRPTHSLQTTKVTENEDCTDDVLMSDTESSSGTSSSDSSWHGSESSSSSTEDRVDSRPTHLLQTTKVTENEDCTDDVLVSDTESSSGTSSSDSSWHGSESSSSLEKGHKRVAKKNKKNATDANQQTSTFQGKAQSSRLLKAKAESAGTSRRSPPGKIYFQSERRPVTIKEKLMALQKAEAVRSTRPHFIKVMTPTHVYHHFYMALPQELVQQNLFQIPVNALLQVTGSSETWEVSFYRRRGRSVGQVLTDGKWKDFVMGYNLEEGDALLFELDINHSNRKDFAMFYVTIFRVVDEIVPLKSCRLGSVKTQT